MGWAPAGREARPKGSLLTKPQRGRPFSHGPAAGGLRWGGKHTRKGPCRPSHNAAARPGSPRSPSPTTTLLPDGPDVHRPLLHSVGAAWSVAPS